MVDRTLGHGDDGFMTDSLPPFRKEPPENPGTLAKETSRIPPAPSMAGLSATVLLVAASAGVIWLGGPMLPDPTAPLIFLIAVLLSAVAFGFWTGLVAAGVAFGVQNFFFTDPVFTMHVARPQDLIVLLVFLLVAGLAGFLAGRLHDQAAAATARSEVLEILSGLSAELGTAETEARVIEVGLRRLARLCRGTVVALRSDDPAPTLVVSIPETFIPNMSELQAAERALRLNRVEPAAVTGWEDGRLTMHPLAETATGALVVGYTPTLGHEGARRATAIDALCQQMRQALQRVDFASRAQTERRRAETEATRSALLSSLSHDLRTPLATILGAASALKELDASLVPAARADLLTAIEEEATRLNRHVTNLLQMTRLETGIQLHLAWVDAADLAQAAVLRARRAWPLARIEIDLPLNLPMIRADGSLIEQAVFNLIDNAIHHGAPPVRVVARLSGSTLQLQVSDTGSGVSTEIADWLSSSDSRPSAGQRGLGLAVAKGIARVLGGTLCCVGPGSSFSLSFPVPQSAESP